jgi:hypothetical protein
MNKYQQKRRIRSLKRQVKRGRMMRRTYRIGTKTNVSWLSVQIRRLLYAIKVR